MTAPGAAPPPPGGPPPSSTTGIAVFRQALFARTRRAWVTRTLVAVNVAVLIAMVVTGVDPWLPKTDDLLAWGANYAPRDTAGQWWRLLTGAFIHVGALHLAMNMFALWQIGSLVERLISNRAFLVTYLVAGLCGSVASIAWSPHVVSAGASGAVFGVYGVLVAFLLRHRGSIPSEVLRPLGRSAVFFVVVNLTLGAAVKGIDAAAHVGGLVAGFGGGLIVSRPFGGGPARARASRELLLLGLCAGVIAAAVLGLPRAVDLQAEITDFVKMQETTLATYNDAVERLRAARISDAQLAQILDDDVLPGWRLHQRRLRGLGRLPPEQKKWVDRVAPYIALRTQAWSKLSEGLRAGDVAMQREAAALQGQADAVAAAPETSSP